MILTGRTWGNLARDTEPHYESAIDVKEDGYIVGGGTFKFTIKYRQKSFDSFTP